jgi:hypothetical protein
MEGRAARADKPGGKPEGKADNPGKPDARAAPRP